jgi:hypothetical protein
MSNHKSLAHAYFGSDRFIPSLDRIAAINQAITSAGFWEEEFEWRISTTRISRIEPAKVGDFRTFHVTVQCDFKLECHCPTLERAVQYERIYSQLIADMFYMFGWPGCPAKNRYEPLDSETKPA